MLTPEALDVVWPLTERCDQNGFILEPMQGTPLEALVRETRSGPEFNSVQVDGSFTPDVVAITMVANAVNPLVGINSHTECMDDIAKPVIAAIQGHISFARTVVAPAVEALALKVSEELSNQTVSSLLGMEVLVVEAPALLTNTNFGNMVDKFHDIPFDNPPTVLNLPDQTATELKELFKTGSANVDGDVAEWIAERGDGYLLDIYAAAFQCKQEGPDSIGGATFRGLVTDKVSGTDNAIAIFLLANRLLEEPISGTEMDNRQYQNLMADFRGQAGAQLCRIIAKMFQDEKSGILVTGFTTNKITVAGGVYRKWLDEGGDNETLFGNLLTQPVMVTTADITANADRFKQEWNRHCVVITAIESTKRFNTTKETLSSVFRQQLNEIESEVDGVTDNAQSIAKKFDDLLEDVVESDLECMFSLALRLVCRSRFYNTDAEEILSSMETYKKSNPALSIGEVATIVYLKYIAKWVAKQMVVRAI